MLTGNEQSNIKLFNDDGNSIAIPTMETLDIEKQENFKSEDITEILAKPIIKSVQVKEGTVVAPYNYVFDFSQAEEITTLRKDVLRALIDDVNGNIVLYLYGKNGLHSIGKGEKYHLARIIPLIKSSVLDEKVKVYRDFQPDKPLDEIKGRDITRLRLNL